MKTTWLDVRRVLLEDENEQTQQYAEGLPNAVEVGAKNTNSNKWVYIPITLNRFSFLRIGYQYKRWATDCRSKISKVAIQKMAAPGHPPTVIHEEDVCLNSETYRFYTFPIIKAGDPCQSLSSNLTTCEDEPFDPNALAEDGLPTFFSHEGFFLALKIEIVDFRDRFVIGPVGVEDHSSDIVMVSPMDFGAVGDGVTDDFEALKETVLYALANRLHIDLAHRTYAFSQTLHIKPPQPNYEGFTLRNGELHYTNSSGVALLVDNFGTTPVHMADVGIVGKSDTGLELGRALNSLFERVTIQDRLLFSLGLEFEEDLGTSPISADLRKQFKTRGYVVGAKETILQLAPSKWQITDVNGRKYTLRKEGQPPKLNIYRGFKVGLRLRGSVGNAFSSCSFRDNEVNVQIETYEPDGKRSNDNKFWNCKLNGATGIASLHFPDAPSTPGLTAANNAFYACDFERSAQHAVVVDGGHGTSFIDCRFEAAFLNIAQAHPWSMIQLGKGRNSRIVNCWFPGMITPTSNDSIIRVDLQHVGARIINSVFSGSQRILFDPGNNVESYGNWALPNKF